MNWQFFLFPLIIFGVLLYSICQKSIPKNANALLVIASAYFIAFTVSIVVFLLKGNIKNALIEFSGQKWLPVILLGLSLPMVEFGFLFIYRFGWKISTTALITNSFSMIGLALLGVLWYKEELSALNVVGICLSVAGIICVNIR
ncbi:MAG TPA: EamA family transporter [Bacteroidota bacterium]|nr:EamA family transporter [Bacteroidota bacterium]